MEYYNKLRLLLEEKGLTQYEFAELLNESLSQINKVLNGHRKISASMVEKLVLNFPEIDLNWLLKRDVTAKKLINEEGAKYYIEQNPTQILNNIEEEIKVLKTILSQK